MHLEILVEDQSGQKALEILVPKIIGAGHSFKVIPYRGIGHIPPNLGSAREINHRKLLDQLPRLLRGYGKTFSSYSPGYKAAVIVVCDLDNKCLKEFRHELCKILESCNPKPETCFCIAVEEVESWFLGDIAAIKSAYPKAKEAILKQYKNDSICGTWELLADAVLKGGRKELAEKGYREAGREKRSWAENIAPCMNIEKNASPSFNYFRKKLTGLVGEKPH